MNDYQFGNHLYQLRHQAGYTQKEVADHCGVSNKAVGRHILLQKKCSLF